MSQSLSGPASIWTTPGPNGRGVLSPVELIRRAHQRLQERFDPTKSRHKPLSILRQEARRLLDQYFEVEWPALAKTDRERQIEDVLGEAPGFSPLEELFRDETTNEILVIAANQIIAKKGDAWLPTSVRFRDVGQFRSLLKRYAETGEPLVSNAPTGTGGFDVRLINGYRCLAILPPDILEQGPWVLFFRPEALPMPAGASSVMMSTLLRNSPKHGSPPAKPGTGSIAMPPARGGSGLIATPAPRMSGVMDPPKSRLLDPVDPLARLKSRITERIIAKCSAAGVYDLSVIPAGELQRVVHAHVIESSMNERIPLDDATKERVVLEILAKMNR